MSPEEFARQAELSFRDPGLLELALTHRSYVNEQSEPGEDNERLEYLGDAALDFLTAAWLFERFPEVDEGELTRLRSALVRTEQLADFGRDLRLGEAMRLGRGEEASGGREREALLCGTFEALIGALYLDAGLQAVADFMAPRLEQATRAVLEEQSHLDPRSALQIWAQAEVGETPRYRTVSSSGPDHAREFVVEVSVGDSLQGLGQGRSKQEAAQQAAANVLERLPRERRDGERD